MNGIVLWSPASGKKILSKTRLFRQSRLCDLEHHVTRRLKIAHRLIQAARVGRRVERKRGNASLGAPGVDRLHDAPGESLLPVSRLRINVVHEGQPIPGDRLRSWRPPQ